MFSNPNGLRNMPKTYSDCEALWTPRRAKKGYFTLASNTTLTFNERYGRFEVTYWRTQIAHIYPSYTAMFTGGHDSSPTTIGRLNSFTRASIYTDSSLGYQQNLRIDGVPFFDGIRVHPNGRVFDEDRHSDFFTRPKKDVVQSYVKLFNWIKKHLRLRFHLGEFEHDDWDGRTLDLAGLNQMRLGKDEFVPHQMVKALFMARPTGEFEECISVAREHYRDAFYKLFDGYETIEVKNER